MASINFYLDTRSTKGESPSPLKIAIRHKHKTAFISLGISLMPEQWDKVTQKIRNRPDKQILNNILHRRYIEIESLLFELTATGELKGCDATQIKNRILKEINPEDETPDNLFANRFLKFIESKEKKGTKSVYRWTYTKLESFSENLSSLKFEDITKGWLTSFETFLSQTESKNSRNIHLRNIRAVFNDAIDDEITTFYPFRKFKIRPVATPKRSLSVDQLRILFQYSSIEKHSEKYLDMFKLIFFLIGINIVDLCNLRGINDGRIEYYRAKTNRLYSIKVEPEAMDIINKYRGEKYLLNIMDNRSDYKSFVSRMNKEMKRIGDVKRVGRGGKKVFEPLFPGISTYWARHSWATIAAELDIPKETIAAALGHGGNTVTDIYISFDRKKIDEANRRVIDYVLYRKM